MKKRNKEEKYELQNRERIEDSICDSIVILIFKIHLTAALIVMK